MRVSASSREVRELLEENNRRLDVINAPFNPYTGFGSVGKRVLVKIPDFKIPEQWLPVEMLDVPLVRQIIECGSLRNFVLKIEAEAEAEYPEGQAPQFDFDDDREKVIKQFIRLRCEYDFPFWAAFYVMIKNKDGGEDVHFCLTRPQRKFVGRLEKLRKANKPIRLILLKARQWGGSTTSQIYMAWLQLVHKVGLNSLIIAHQGAGSDEILDMFDRMIKAYPLDMLYELGETYADNERKYENVGMSGSIHRVPQRNCKIKVGTAERPNGCRGGSYNLVHLSEVALWKTTDGKKPEDIVQSACSGVLYRPYTMIVFESTAYGTGNLFQTEYDAAKKGQSQYEAMFVAWFDIDQYSLPFASEDERADFAIRLWVNRNNRNVNNEREECGAYLYYLWQQGATLEAIHWYVIERSGRNNHASMASEYPSDDIEAFQHSGERVFDMYNVRKLRPSCKPPRAIGEVYGLEDEGPGAMKKLRFDEDHQGLLWIWEYPEIDDKEKVLDRYLVSVDVGGRSKKADYSVITVFDRMFMIDGGKPEVVAQWYGHCDIDVLAWKAAQIAAYYDDALLVIESNTLETHDKERWTEGDQGEFILSLIKDVYPNLYARKQSEQDIREKRPVKYGYHTNVSTKPALISTLVKVVRKQLYVERDGRCLDEYLVYERKPNGAYGAIVGKHDDMLMSRAIGLRICFFEMDVPRIVPRHPDVSYLRKKAVSAATI